MTNKEPIEDCCCELCKARGIKQFASHLGVKIKSRKDGQYISWNLCNLHYKLNKEIMASRGMEVKADG